LIEHFKALFKLFSQQHFPVAGRLSYFKSTKKQIHSLLCFFPRQNRKTNQLGRNPQRQSADPRASFHPLSWYLRVE
jgi:hypothetical protein